MNVERLLKLADFGENIAEDNFNMGMWYDHDPECGTMGCIIGHALTENLFGDCGPKLAREGNEVFFQGKTSFEALGLFFVITRDEAHYLFSALSYKDRCDTTPREVVGRIRDFVKERSL